MDLTYVIKGDVSIESIGALRKSVGWNKMMDYHEKSLQNSYLYICCYENDKLIGFLDVISNGSSDAYIQDVMVSPQYQCKGIGTTLMNIAIENLKKDKIYAISVLYDERLINFYKKFSFNIMYAGQIITE